MARPNKQGVDYFPLDVHLDDKFKFIEIKYKLEGFAILIKLMQKIYSCGYWYKWTEDENFLFADEIRADFDLVKNVVNECIEREVFDKEMHIKYNILTSNGIQKRYKEIVRRRKDVEVIEEYLLIDNNFGVNAVINPSLSKHDDDKSTQSKRKETKVNESSSSIANTIENPIQLFEKSLCRLSPIQSEKLYMWVDDFDGQNEIINEAILIADDRNKRNFGFVEFLLKEWSNNKLHSLDRIKAYEQEKFNKAKTNNVTPLRAKQEPQGRAIPTEFNFDLSAGED